MPAQRSFLVGTGVLSLALTGSFSVVADAASGPTFQCVAVDANNCTVTIPLTTNVDEQVGSTMPDTRPWYLRQGAGVGPYGLTGPGNPDTYWNGISGASRGSVWSATLTTNANEPANSEAVLTFSHFTTTPKNAAVHYSSMSYTYPMGAAEASSATITANGTPKPAGGNLVLQRLQASSCVKAAVMTYSASQHDWTVKVRWEYPKNAAETFRVLVLAEKGLLATHTGSFRISTLP